MAAYNGVKTLVEDAAKPLVQMTTDMETYLKTTLPALMTTYNTKVGAAETKLTAL